MAGCRWQHDGVRAVPATPGRAARVAARAAARVGRLVWVVTTLPPARPGVLVQGSPHRFGLPAAVAAVAIAGVVTLLVRVLAADPALRRNLLRRSGPVDLGDG